MHIIAILTSLAILIFWVTRAAQGMSQMGGSVRGAANLPRKMRHMKKQGRSGLALVSDPREAAAVLMVAVARLSGDGRVNEAEDAQIQNLLVSNMAFESETVEEFVLNIRWLTRDLKQPVSTLRPMTALLQKAVSRAEAEDLAHMLTEIAITSSAATQNQTAFIYRYREAMGLNVGV